MISSAPHRGHTFLLAAIVAALGIEAPLASAQQAPAGGTAAAAPSAGKAAAAAPTAGKASSKAAEPAAGDKNAASYSLGVSMGERLRAGGITPDAVNGERIAQGVHDGLSGKAKMTDADRANIEKLLRAAHDVAAETGHHAATKFLAENGKKTGITTTASGLQYRVVSAGTGESPKPTDEVTVNYRGRLADGTEFDSSYKRGQPATFPVNRVIPGWTEGLQLMKTGGKYELYIPPQLAYDLSPPPGSPISPGALLVFDVELISFKPAAATGQAAPAQPAQPAQPAK